MEIISTITGSRVRRFPCAGGKWNNSPNTPFPLGARASVEKPIAETGNALPSARLVFALSKEGQCYFGGSRKGLPEAQDIMKLRPGVPVVWRGDVRQCGSRGGQGKKCGPAEREGEPVAARVLIPYEFKLK